MIVKEIGNDWYDKDYYEIQYEWVFEGDLVTLNIPVYSHLNIFNEPRCKINREEFLFCADYIYELVKNKGYALDDALALIANSPDYFSINKCVCIMLGLASEPTPEDVCSAPYNIYAYLLLMARAIYDTDKLFGIFFDSTKYENQVEHNQKLLNMYNAIRKCKEPKFPYHKHFSFLNSKLKAVNAEIKRHNKLLLGKPSTKYSIVKTPPQVKEAFDILMRILSVFSDNKDLFEFQHCSFCTESKSDFPNRGTFSKKFFISVGKDKIPVHINYFNCEGYPIHNKFLFSAKIAKLELDLNAELFSINATKIQMFLRALFMEVPNERKSVLYYKGCFVVDPDDMCNLGEKFHLNVEHAYSSLTDLDIKNLLT